jgi:hypothetical protein
MIASQIMRKSFGLIIAGVLAITGSVVAPPAPLKAFASSTNITSELITNGWSEPTQRAYNFWVPWGSRKTPDVWWCAQLDGLPIDRSVVQDFTWWDLTKNNNSEFLLPWASNDGQILQNYRCIKNGQPQYFSGYDINFMFDRKKIGSNPRNFSIYWRYCASQVESDCALENTVIGSEPMTLQVQIPLSGGTFGEEWSRPYIASDTGELVFNESLRAEPYSPDTKVEKYCLEIDGVQFDSSALVIDSNRYFGFNLVEGCFVPKPGVENSQTFGFSPRFDPYKFSAGNHSATITATLNNGKQTVVTRQFNIPSNLPVRISEGAIVQGAKSIKITHSLAWPKSISSSATAQWLIDGTEFKRDAITPGVSSVELTLTPGDVSGSALHEFTLNVIIADATSKRSTNFFVNNRDPALNMAASLDKQIRTGTLVNIAGVIENTDGFFPSTVQIRTKNFAKSWSKWSTVKVSSGKFSLPARVVRNTKYQVSVQNTWTGKKQTVEGEIGAVPKTFNYSIDFQRTRINGFNQGAVVNFRVKADSDYNAKCTMVVASDYAFNFAAVWVGKETKWGYINLKRGTGSGNVNVRYNGEYASNMLCIAPGYADVSRFEPKIVLRISG